MDLGLCIIDDQGDVVPCPDVPTWAKWFEARRGPVRVARTVLENGVIVSTLFLGIDHGFGGTPLIFETMIFFLGEWRDQYRYPNWETAAVHHLELVAYWRERGPNE